jgi:hypothetical protein
LHDVAPSAHAPGRDGRLREPRPRHRNVLERSRFLRWIRRTRTTACAPHRTLTPRGVNDPQRRWPGAAPATRHRGRSRPALGPPTGRARLRGRHTAPSELDDSTRTTCCRTVSSPHDAGETFSQTRVANARGCSSIGGQVRFWHLSPLQRELRAQPGKKPAASLRARDQHREQSKCAICSGKNGERNEEQRALRPRRPGGRGAGTASE